MEALGEEAITRPQVNVSSDGMEARLMLPIPEENKSYRLQDLYDILKTNGITAGIDESALKRIIERGLYGIETCVAMGALPIEGQDGQYKFNFNSNFSKEPKIRPDGSVDYWSINVIETVVEGQVIAIYQPAVQGEDGYTVKNKPIPAKRAKEQQPLKGSGFNRSNDNLTYTAAIDGKISNVNGRIMVLPVYEICGNVDLNTGNVDFRGDVLIHGNVSADAKVKATGTVTIDGVVEGGYVEAGKDVILRGGVFGNGEGSIVSKGDIFAKFFEYAMVSAEGTIQADSFLDSKVRAGHKVILSGKRGSIIGGSVSAVSGIEAAVIGNMAGVTTDLQVGNEPEIRQRLKVLEKKIEIGEETIRKLEQGLKEFELLELEKGVSLKEDPRRMQILRSKIQNTSMIMADRGEQQEIFARLELAKEASIIVNRSIFAGVIVKIDELILMIKDRQDIVEFKKKNDKITMTRAEESGVK